MKLSQIYEQKESWEFQLGVNSSDCEGVCSII